jgi:hypothetical protein
MSQSGKRGFGTKELPHLVTHTQRKGCESRTADMYAPVIKTSRRVREHILSPNRSAVLMADIEIPEERPPGVEYEYLLVVFDRRVRDPLAFISSERAGYDDELAKELGFEGFAPDPNSGSHFLCAFLPDGRSNYGASNDWADMAKFERAALDLVHRLGLVEGPAGPPEIGGEEELARPVEPVEPAKPETPRRRRFLGLWGSKSDRD